MSEKADALCHALGAAEVGILFAAVGAAEVRDPSRRGLTLGVWIRT
jgi:hypothetical protein